MMSEDIAKVWASIVHFARTGKDYDTKVPNMDAAIYAADLIDGLRAENERMKAEITGILEQAHMAGQADAGVDPGYSNAQVWAAENAHRIFGIEPPTTGDKT